MKRRLVILFLVTVGAGLVPGVAHAGTVDTAGPIFVVAPGTAGSTGDPGTPPPPALAPSLSRFVGLLPMSVLVTLNGRVAGSQPSWATDASLFGDHGRKFG